MLIDIEHSHAAPVKTAMLSNSDIGRNAAPFTNAVSPPAANAGMDLTGRIKTEPGAAKSAFVDLSAADGDPGASIGIGSLFAPNARSEIPAKFAANYRSIAKVAALLELSRMTGSDGMTMITGAVSTYNPYREGSQEGDAQTASGEFYDPAAWTAAIQTDLRNKFGGVRYGRLYQPAYALVESGQKQVIVKINDVGPLRSGRVLDLNERSMRYFDPFMTRGVIDDVRITLLPGEDWTPGPIGDVDMIGFAGLSD